MKSRPAIPGLIVGLLFQLIQAEANPNQPLDRPYTLRNAQPAILEMEMARQISSPGPMSFIFPRPCFSELDSSRVCGEIHGFSYRNTNRHRQLSVSPLFGYEYRYLDESINAFDGGLLATGNSGPLSFYLDARMFTELHENRLHPSYDGELVERQDENASGSIAYSSYSRYRSHITLDLDWARFSAGRDAVHWGPGLWTNLAFHQDALPFNQISWLSHLGPLTVISLYGQLVIQGDSFGSVNTNSNNRSLYAHRYEWRATRNFVLGISEQLVVYNQEDPFAFVPVIPLFILKGAGVERQNNGNISFDAAYRWHGIAKLYSEFFIDDIQSPTSLFDDNWGNKWAWMLGAHFTHELPAGQAGLVVEYSRVEPWVYTHYQANTAQSANGGYPLGNALGPNSQWMVMKCYWRDKNGLYLGLRGDMTWKGDDLGSGIQDERLDGETIKKAFLYGVGEPRIGISPQGGYRWKSVYLEATATLGRKTEVMGRVFWGGDEIVSGYKCGSSNRILY